MRDQVFISYSHRDAEWLARLQVYLAPLVRQGRIQLWDDTRIAPGMRWEDEIGRALERTRVALLLVSAEFLASEFITGVELPRLLGAADDHGVVILPVVLDHCNFRHFPEIAQFQAVNDPARPLETLDTVAQKAELARIATVVESACGGDPRRTATPAASRLIGVPARSLHFRGRSALLRALHERLLERGRIALCGLPGMGKTELAVEYIARHRADLDWVFWCNASSETTLLRGFGEIAAALRLPEAGGASQPEAARAVLRALGSQRRWLLVLDAADDPAAIKPWLPAGDGGQVLITTRSVATAGVAEAIELDALDEADAVAALLSRAGRADVVAAGSDEEAAARTIVGHLGGVPLAIDQAGAYVEETGTDFAEYAELLRLHARDLLAERGGAAAGDDTSLWDAWSVALQQLEAGSPAAVELLRLYAFFDREALPEAALGPVAVHAGPTLATALAQPLSRNAVVREALRFSFLRRDAKHRQLRMHAMVRRFLQDGLDADARALTVRRGLALLDAMFPEARFDTWATCEGLAPHVESVLDAAAALPDGGGAATARLAIELGYYRLQRARRADAVMLIERGLGLRRLQAMQASGDPQPGVPASVPPPVQALARALVVAARAQAETARFDDAERLLREASDLLAAGPATPARVEVLDRLASLAIDRGDLDAAATWLEAAREQVHLAGAERSVEAAQCANDEGVVAFRRGRYAAAAEAFDRAATLRRELLPEGHPARLWSIHNLAAARARLGDRARARELYDEVLALRERHLGADHPNVADTLVNVGLMEQQDGRLDAARTALDRAVAIYAARRGESHPETATARHALAGVDLAAGRLDAAERGYARAREDRLAALGPGHEFSARAQVGLGRVALARGDAAAAARHLAEALGVLESRLGHGHDETAACAADLAVARRLVTGRAD